MSPGDILFLFRGFILLQFRIMAPGPNPGARANFPYCTQLEGAAHLPQTQITGSKGQGFRSPLAVEMQLARWRLFHLADTLPSSSQNR